MSGWDKLWLTWSILGILVHLGMRIYIGVVAQDEHRLRRRDKAQVQLMQWREWGWKDGWGETFTWMLAWPICAPLLYRRINS